MSESTPPVDDPTTLPAGPDAEDSAVNPGIPEAEAAPDPLSQALLDAAQWKDTAHRTAAELDNYRKRTARELTETVKYANAGLLESLLPVLDNFDYGMAAAKAESEGSNLYIGLNMVLRQIQDFLKDHGVEEISAVGESFDPNLHEAVSTEASASVPEGKVISRSRKGYKLRDRLLRPASVVVSSGPSPAAGDAAGPSV